MKKSPDIPQKFCSGFYKGTLNCSWKGGRVNQTVQVGYAPEDILPPLTKEADQKILGRIIGRVGQSRSAVQAHSSTQVEQGNCRVYEVRMRSYGNIRVRRLV